MYVKHKLCNLIRSTVYVTHQFFLDQSVCANIISEVLNSFKIRGLNGSTWRKFKFVRQFMVQCSPIKIRYVAYGWMDTVGITYSEFILCASCRDNIASRNHKCTKGPDICTIRFAFLHNTDLTSSTAYTRYPRPFIPFTSCFIRKWQLLVARLTETVITSV